jgi:hypothetical protein
MSTIYSYLSTCDKCRGLVMGEYRLLDDIERGHKAGCGICSLVFKGVAALSGTLGKMDVKKLKAMKCAFFSNV